MLNDLFMTQEHVVLIIKWLSICVCVSQSAIFSGLNLAFFSVSKLRLTVEKEKGNKDAAKILKLREDSNFLLTTILWGNVGVNVLLALISESVLTGLSAFVFSTVVITVLGEIMPQAFFSRHAMKSGALLSPVIRIYSVLLYPVAKPSAWVLDRWLGKEAIPYFQENDFKELIRVHVESEHTNIDHVEGAGVLNFLELDDIPVSEEGETILAKSIISMDFKNGRPIFPEITPSRTDDFLKTIQASEKKWVVITDRKGMPCYVIDSDHFIRTALFDHRPFVPFEHCHKPVVIKDAKMPLGQAILSFKVEPVREDDDVIDYDILLVWSEKAKKIITGADILGRLMRGISDNKLMKSRVLP